MKNKIKILAIIGIIAVVVLGIIVYAVSTTETETGTIIYYAEDGVTEIARQDVTQGSTFTILDNAVATEGRWISTDKGLTFAIGQKLAWNSGLFPLKLRAYRDDLIYSIPDEEPTQYAVPPYIPTGYSYVEGTGTGSNEGYTIQDSFGNQYIWIEVPRTTTVYPTAGLSITEYTDAEYTKIENDLHTYTSAYRSGTSYTDTYYSDETTGLTSTQYNKLKQKMLKSVYQHGGFYVGKYEAGTTTARTSSDDALTTPVIQQNVYPYNYITTAQAQSLASGMASGDYTSSLMFGVQWDLVLKYLEEKGEAQSELNVNSTNWGNYRDNLWNITNTNSKYYDSSWVSGAYGQKRTQTDILLSTGASETFSKHGIYDLAGNVWEFTLERTFYVYAPCVPRGGDYYFTGSSSPASYRFNSSTDNKTSIEGFRIALYQAPYEEEEEIPSYIPEGFTHVAETTMDDGYTIEDSSGNQYVWIEVPQTEEVYPTAGLAITEFTDAEYTSIENDLNTYTADYKEGTDDWNYEDTYNNVYDAGLTTTQYNELKQKMLKSIYQNGGFYIGKYETGTTTERLSNNASLTTPVIKQNVYPYNWVTTKQAQTLASDMASGEYTSSLLFGVQWDLVMKHLENKGAATQSELITNSKTWGNYEDNYWTITNTNAKYWVYKGTSENWISGAYGKKADPYIWILLSTGADSSFSRLGIYDLAGNLAERTLEFVEDPDAEDFEFSCTMRGGNYLTYGSASASYRAWQPAETAFDLTGFRVAIY